MRSAFQRSQNNTLGRSFKTLSFNSYILQIGTVGGKKEELVEKRGKTFSIYHVPDTVTYISLHNYHINSAVAATTTTSQKRKLRVRNIKSLTQDYCRVWV